MPGYVLLRSEKGSDLTPAEADNNQKNLYDFKAEKADLDDLAVRTDALETSQAAQDTELSALNARTGTLEASQTTQDTELADHEARIGAVEADLANHDHDAAEVSFSPAGDITATNVQDAIEQVDANKQGIDARGQPDGYAPLDAGGKLPQAFLPDAVTRYKGYYATVPELVAAYPVGTPGDTALIGSTDTLWAWDTDTGSWVDTGSHTAVDSVNGKTGSVLLEAADIPFTPVVPFTATESQTAIEQARTMANAHWLDSVPVAMAGAADGYLLKVTGPPGSEQVVAVPGVSAGIPVNAVRRYFDSTTTTIDGVTYFNVESSPPPPAAVPVTAVNTDTTAATDNLITRFISEQQGEQLSFPSGLWAFRLWLQASHTNCTLVLSVSRLNTDTFAKTLIHTASWPVSGMNLEQFAYDYEQPSSLTLETNERIVVDLFCRSPSGGRTLTLTFDGVDRQSYVDVPVALQHNSQSGLQGGAGDERFHFTADEHAALLDVIANGAGRIEKQIFEQSGTFVKPAGAKSIEVFLIGGGGGGASGAVSATGAAAPGGGGGGGGARTQFLMDASLMANSCAVLVGAPGVGGAASTGFSNPGTDGGVSQVNNGQAIYRADGGRGSTGVGAGQAANGLFAGGAGGAGGGSSSASGNSGSGTLGGTTTSFGGGGPGGGGGAGLTSANAEGPGGAAAFSSAYMPPGTSPGGSGGASGGGDGLDAATGSGYSGYKYPGVSGGGGGSNLTGNGGKGGNAGGHGAGGGGGGAARTGSSSGAGGNGSPGVVIFVIYF